MTTLIDPRQLAGMADLELLARSVVEGFLSGVHRSPNTGSSVEFAQYRPYTQGDDLRFLDWKLFGRTDRLHLKQFQEETNLRCTILLDCSASMDYGTTSMTKFAYGRALCACLATILRKQGDALGLICYHEDLLCHLPPSADSRQLRRILVQLANIQAAEATDAPGALRFLGDVLKPRGMVVLITDFLHPLPEVVAHLKSLRARRHDVLVMQISDPAERDFPFDKSLTLQDLEDNDELFVVPDEVREAYLENRANHFSAVRAEALGAEVDIVELSCDQPLDQALRSFLHHRTKTLKTKGLRKQGGSR